MRLVERILLLVQAANCGEALEAVESAMENAHAPQALSAGILAGQEPGEEEIRLLARQAHLHYVVSDANLWQSLEMFWQGEPLVLMGHPGLRFERGWDRRILKILRKCPERTVLTGCPPCPLDLVDAMIPVAAEEVREGVLKLGRGSPLRYVCSPQKAAFLNPCFCFGPSAFFRSVDPSQPLFLEAWRGGWNLMTLHARILSMTGYLEMPRIRLEAGEELERFCEFCGMDVRRGEVSTMLRTGILKQKEPEIHVPLQVKIQEGFRRLDNVLSPLAPLCVTTCMSLPNRPVTDLEMARFRRLCGIRDMTVLCYADRENLRRVLLHHPNTREFKRSYGLVREGRIPPEEMEEYLRLSVPSLLLHTWESSPEYSHYIAMDFDYLRYSVYDRTALDWRTVCGGRITLAMVDGKPDLGMVAVPGDCIRKLQREFQALVNDALMRTYILPAADGIWLRVIREHPDWFQLLDLPGPSEMLALTMTVRGEEWKTRR